MRFFFRFSVFLILATIAGFVVVYQIKAPTTYTAAVSTSSQPAAVNQAQLATSTHATTTRAVATTTVATSTPKSVKKPASKPKNTALPPVASTTFAVRKEDPYATAPDKFEAIDLSTREALVNILCMPQGGTLRPISGSGVIIDPRGVILTNAHVAQYVLLSQSKDINLVCSIRSGSPATFRWKAKVLYMPPVWVNAHYQEISAGQVIGTGVHDYALLLITSDMQGNPVTAPLPYLPVETRANIAFQGDPVLVGGYPAEFVGGLVAQQNLYAATSLSTIQKLLTFVSGSIDVFSVGGVIEAQGGSSGGPVVNAWHRVVAIITTTSDGKTTSDRELHTLSTNYIDRDLTTQTSKGLDAILSGDVSRLSEEFSRETVPQLLQKYIDYLKH